MLLVIIWRIDTQYTYVKRWLFVRSVIRTTFIFLYFTFKEVVRAEMTPRRKRRLTYITIGLFFLLGGVEYGKLYLLMYC